MSLDDDKGFTDYLSALTSLEACPAGRYMIGLNQHISTDFFKCRCGAAEVRALGELEAFCTVKDYKVVEGLRKKEIPCECTPGAFARRLAAVTIPMVVLPQTEPQPDQKKYSRREEREYGGVKYYCYFYGEDDWLHRKIEEAKNNPVKDFIAEWTNPDPLSFGTTHPFPEFPSFLDIAKHGVRMADRPKAIPGRRGTSFFQHPCDALEGLLPVFGESCLATVTDEKTGVTRSLDEALKEVRHKGESFPSPFSTNTYTVKPDV
jgi:hypothetical protein